MSDSFSYLSSADLTDVGRRRKNNEDSLIRLPESGVFCVADGMGGVQGGEVASKAVVDALREAFTVSPDETPSANACLRGRFRYTLAAGEPCTLSCFEKERRA